MKNHSQRKNIAFFRIGRSFLEQFWGSISRSATFLKDKIFILEVFGHTKIN
jgi:hypothetical protein